MICFAPPPNGWAKDKRKALICVSAVGTERATSSALPPADGGGIIRNCVGALPSRRLANWVPAFTFLPPLSQGECVEYEKKD